MSGAGRRLLSQFSSRFAKTFESRSGLGSQAVIVAGRRMLLICGWHLTTSILVTSAVGKFLHLRRAER